MSDTVCVNRTTCEGIGVCADVAPTVFALDDTNTVAVLAQPADAQELAGARRAAGFCPTESITVSDS